MNPKWFSRTWQALLVIVFVFITAAPAPPVSTWLVETVDSPKEIKNTSPNMLKLYNNHPRVAYGGDRLYYAYSNNHGGSWTVTTVDASDGVGGRVALTLDGSGNPYIGYFDDGNRNLKFAGMDPNNPTAWYYETVDAGSSGDHLAIALDSLGQPHIAYFAASSLNHAWRTCSGSFPTLVCTWHTELLLPGVNPNNISLAISSTDKLHIAYYGGTNQKLNYLVQGGSGANCVSNTYRCDIVDATLTAGQSGISLQLYSNVARIAYGNPSDGQHFAYYDGATWQLASINATIGTTPSLVLTAAGLPRILFSTSGAAVKVLTGTTTSGGTWSISDVTGSDYTQGSSGAIQTTGDLSVVYWTAPFGQMLYNRQSSGTWQGSTAFDTLGTAGQDSIAMVINSHNQLSIAYQEGLKRHLRFATTSSVPSGCNEATGPWKCETVNNEFGGAGVGNDISMALKSDGIPGIGFSDLSGNYYQDYAYYVGTGGTCPGNTAWNCERVAWNTIWAGFDNSIAFTPAGNPRIAFFDYGGPNLWLATYIGSGGTTCPGGNTAWSCQIIETGQGSNGGFTQIAIRSDGKAVISYFNSNSQKVRMALEVTSGSGGCTGADNPTSWKCFDVATNVGTYDVRNSLVLVSDTDARLSFYDANNTDPAGGGLKYATVSLPGGTSTIQTVDNGTYSGYYNSLAVYQGTPMIAFHVSGESTNALRFARWVGSGAGDCPGNSDWKCEVIDGRRNLGHNLTMKVTSFGIPYVAYFDPLTGDLLMAHLSFYQGFLPATVKP